MTEKEINKRTEFILNAAADFTPSHIVELLKQEGFVPVSRSRIYHILNEAGIKPLAKRNYKTN
jgi:transposase